MILKVQTPPEMATNCLHLSIIDQNNVRVYTQTVTIFPFPNGLLAEAAIRALEDGLSITLQKFPWLSGTLSLASPELGTLSLTYPTEIPDVRAARLLKSKQIPYHDQDFPYTYEQLKRDGMPPSAFKGEMFRPDDFANYPGIPANGEGQVDFSKSDAPAMRIQAFFFPGGLALSIYIHHTVLDCSGINEFWRHYAADVAKAAAMPKGELEDKAPPTIPDQSTLRLQLDAQIPPPVPHQRQSAESYIDGAYSYNKTLPNDTRCSQKLFVIPAARIRSFRDELRSFFPNDSPPTICNVLAALIWTHVTRARGARLLANGYEETNIGIAADLRKRQDPPLTVNYMGNMAIFAKGTSKIKDFVSEKHVTTETIIRTIMEIKHTIAKVDDDWIKQHLTFFRSIEKIKNTECALGFRFGPDIYITSWMNFGADHQWGIPGTDLAADSLAGRPEFIRRTYGPSDGGMMILPRRRALVKGVEAPYEIMIRLATEDMERLMAERDGLSRWAHVID